MGLLHVLNCVALCLGPHAVYFQATPLAEYDALRSALHGFSCQCATAFVKMVLLATFLPGSHSSDVWELKDLIVVAVGLTDVIGLWYSLSKCQHRNISNENKFQAVGLGWAFGNSVLTRLFPVIYGARAQEFTLTYVLQAVQSNLVLVQSLSFAACGVLLWNKKGQPGRSLTLLRLMVLLHAVLPALLGLSVEKQAMTLIQLTLLEAAASLLFALGSWQLYSAVATKQA